MISDGSLVGLERLTANQFKNWHLLGDFRALCAGPTGLPAIYITAHDFLKAIAIRSSV